MNWNNARDCIQSDVADKNHTENNYFKLFLLKVLFFDKLLNYRVNLVTPTF